MKRMFYSTLALAAAVALTGCMKEEGNAPEGEQPYSFFDFATTKVGDLKLTYDLSGSRTGIHVDIYGENPWDVTNNVLKDDLQPLGAANIDQSGVFTGKIQLPTYLKSVFVVVDEEFMAAHQVTEVPVVNGNVTFNETNFVVAAASAKSRASFSIPAGYYTFPGADWDAAGLPNYLGERETVPTGLLTDIRKVLKSGSPLPARRPDLVYDGPDESQYKNHSIRVIEDCEVEFVFLTSAASWSNAMAYYTYKTGSKPANPENLEHRTIIFPKMSGTTHPLKAGDKVKLQYWDGAKYVNEFPAGVTIGFILLPDYFRSGNLAKNNYGDQALPQYSDPAYNFYGKTPYMDRRQQSVALFDHERELIVIGFEDRSRGFNSPYNDHDFDDAMFYCDVTPFSAIDPGDDLDPDKEPDPTPQPYVLEYEGTLAFEDLWPWRGDYDMNDVGLTYSSKVYYNADNTISKSVDTFTPVCKGGQHTNGFGFQYGVKVADVKSCAVATEGPAYAYDKVSGTDLEAGQSKAVVMLFADVKDQVSGTASDKDKSKQESLYSYTVTTELKNVSATDLGFPPYNPFIIVQPAGTSEDPRAREIHLTNYAPTDKCTDPGNQWFGKGHDKSDKIGYWYISDWSFPFAINIPTKSWAFPAENQRVDAAYSRFANWARTLGAEDADWWNSKN